jgi:hypothetical protein
VPLGLTELGGQERLDEIPGHRRSNGSSAHTKDVHVIVLNALPGREMVVDQTSADTLDLVGAHRRADAAAADRKAAIHFLSYHRSREWNDEVGIVIVGAQRVSAEIDDLMARSAELSNQLLLQTESAVVGGNSYTHSLSNFLS